MHPDEDMADDGWDEVSGTSPYGCAAALFRRAAAPLEGVHPGLVALLMGNARRDEDLNVRLTELADHAAIWRARDGHFRDEAAHLRRDLDGALARAAAAEKAALGMRQNLTRTENRFVAHCASALNGIHDDERTAFDEPARVVARGSLGFGRHTDERDGETQFRFRLTG